MTGSLRVKPLKRVLNLISQPLGAPSGGLPVHIGKLQYRFPSSGDLDNARGRGSWREWISRYGYGVLIVTKRDGESEMLGCLWCQEGSINKEKGLFYDKVTRCVAGDKWRGRRETCEGGGERRKYC